MRPVTRSRRCEKNRCEDLFPPRPPLHAVQDRLIDLLVTRPDRWTDGHKQIFRPAVEAIHDHPHRFHCDARSGPTPARVHRGYHSLSQVSEQQRRTVRGVHGQHHSRIGGHHSISAVHGVTGICRADHRHDSAVHLGAFDMQTRRKTQRFQHEGAVAIQGRGIVVCTAAEVQGGVGPLTVSADARGKRMGNTRGTEIRSKQQTRL